MMATYRATRTKHAMWSKRSFSFFFVAATTSRGFNTNISFLTSAFCMEPPREYVHRSSQRRYHSSMSSTPIQQETDFDLEIQVAVAAVRKACEITTRLQRSIKMDSEQGSSTIMKSDSSPVTIADFASQAVVLRHLQSFFPDDIFLAEERSDTLTPEATELIRHASGIDDEILLKDCIDLGQVFFRTKMEGDNSDSPESRITHSRFWCLDPIDGTKGFIRMEQYCVALGLVQDGIPTIGILACPNLPSSSNEGNDEGAETGVIFVARRGHGCFELPMISGSRRPNPLPVGSSRTVHDPAQARFCVGVEEGFSDPEGRCKAMAKILHGRLDVKGEIVHSSRMDSQAKWGVIARGDSEFYVRLPRSDHREWLWDVAPGVVVLEEVGGKVTDSAGNPLDFGQGAKLNSNGILGASTANLHSVLLEAYRSS